MSLTVCRQARVDTQHRIALRHAAFRPGTLVNVVATTQHGSARPKASKAYKLFDDLQALASKMERQQSRGSTQQPSVALPADYSLNFEQSLYPQLG